MDTRLKALGLSPVKVKKKPTGDQPPEASGSGVSGKDILVFTRQFATMIDAGLPLVQCLDILASQMDNARFKKVVFAIKAKVEAGSTFADALKDHPKVFDELYVQLCAAGEVGGILDTILNRLANYREKAEKLKRKVKGAMIYPIIVICRGHRRHRAAAPQGDPGVREDVHRLRRRRCRRPPSSSSTCRTGCRATSST